MSSETGNLADTARRALQRIRQLQDELAAERRRHNEPIAIVGMGCRFPGGVHSPEAFWALLAAGIDTATEVPAQRWELERYYDPTPASLGKMYARKGCFIEGADGFDAAFFGIVPREAQGMDPQQRLLLEVVWEALEDAAIAADRLLGQRVGVYVGQMNQDYLDRDFGKPIEELDYHAGLGNTFSITAGRVAYFLGVQGPTLTVDTACSSSLVALHLACQGLRQGECELAVAAGVNLQLAPVTTTMECSMRMLAADGRCKTFDAAADGFVRGDGCGVVILRRLADALAAGDRILALVPGSAVNHDGASGGLTVPNGRAQEQVIRMALERAALAPEAVEYIEAHGTGTALGDPIEVGVLGKVFARPAATPLHIGSVKTNVGHTEGAAGIAGVIKAVLALRHQTIPPSLHFHTPNPHIPWQQLAVRVPVAATPWPSGAAARVAGVSSFGLSGTNAHLLLAEAPAPTVPAATPLERPCHLLTLSAKSRPALAELAGRYRERLAQGEEPLADLCYTANVGRSHFDHRWAVSGGDRAELAAALAARHGGSELAAPPAVAWLFSGQGSQYVGMGQALYESQPLFRQALEECDAQLAEELGVALPALLWGEQGGQLNNTRYTQPALFALEYALGRLWQSWGVEPDAVLGHSVGEYAAAVLSGVFSLAEGARLIAARGRLMAERCGPGAMVALLAEEGQVQGLLADLPISWAATNGERNQVLSGASEAIDELVARAERAGLEWRRLEVSHAFHSDLMEPMLAEFLALAQGIQYQAPRLRFISTLRGAEVSTELTDPEYWVAQVRACVRYRQGLAALRQQGIEHFLEIGPSTTLVGMGRADDGEGSGVWLASQKAGREAWPQLLESLGRLYEAGVAIDWAGFDHPYARRRVVLPTYPFQRQRYWLASVAADSRRRTADLHPLLGERLSTPGPELRFARAISTLNPAYLGGHEVFGQALFPAAGYGELAYAAAAVVAPAQSLKVTELTIAAPLSLAVEPTELASVVTPVAEGWQLAIHARPSGGDWQLQASAHLTAATEISGVLAIDALRARLPPLAVADFYARMAHAGLRYGPAFQGLRECFVGGGEALAALALPELLAEEATAYRIHPVLLDAAIQAAGCALQSLGAQLGEENFLPVALAALELAPQLPPQLWCHARIAEPATLSASSESVVVTLSLADPAGQIVGQLRGLELRRVPRQAAQAQRGEHLYRLEWSAGAPVADSAWEENQGWLLVGEASGLGGELAALLRAHGQRVLLAQPDAGEGAAEARLIADSTPAAYADLLGELAATGGVQGVVLLAGAAPRGAEAEGMDLGALGRQGWLTALQLGQALLAAALPHPPRFCLVTRAAQSVVAGEALPGLPHATLWGMGRSLAREHPELGIQLIDLDPAGGAGEAAALLAELRTPLEEPQIAYRHGDRQLARLRRHPPLADTAGVVAEASYLVVGGLRGLGLRVAEWLVEQGARHLLLLGRRPPAAAAAERIEALRAAGVQVVVAQADIAEHAALAAALQQGRAVLPPLKGVIDCAALLQDALWEQQSEERYRQVLLPKVVGAWHLHTLTRDDPLAWFVLFSSMAAPLGAAGQSNYAAGNAFLDSLAAYRQAQGLPGLSIAWGAWAESGLAVEHGLDSRLAGSGVAPIQPVDGLRWLGQMLASSSPQIACAPIDWGRLAQRAPVPLDRLLLELLPQAAPAAGALLQQLAAAPSRERERLLLAAVTAQIAQVLQLPSREIDPERRLFDIGLDSLMAIEVKGQLQGLVGRPLRSTLLFDFPSAAGLTRHLLKDVLQLPEPPGATPAPAAADEAQLAQRLADKLKQFRSRERA